MSISWRKLRDDIIETCKEATHVYLMISGGVDSIFMLDFITRNTDLKPTVIHFQHGIREDDHHEVKLIKKIATEYDLPFLLGKGVGLRDVKNQEAIARQQRWEFVEAHIEPGSIVMTAHHFDDNLENFLMSSVRGRSVGSLVMRKLHDFGTYKKYKPLLDISKEEIYKQATRRRIKWIEDSTNQSDTLNCERNYWRNVLIPEICKIRNIKVSMRRLIFELQEI